MDMKQLCKKYKLSTKRMVAAAKNLKERRDIIERKMNRKIQKTGELVPQVEFRSRVVHKLREWCRKTLDRCEKRYLAESDPSSECIYQFSLAIDTMKVFSRL
jgi:hypothetical protein